MRRNGHFLQGGAQRVAVAKCSAEWNCGDRLTRRRERALATDKSGVRQHYHVGDAKCLGNGTAVLTTSATEDSKCEGAGIVTLNFRHRTHCTGHVLIRQRKKFPQHGESIAPATHGLSVSGLLGRRTV